MREIKTNLKLLGIKNIIQMKKLQLIHNFKQDNVPNIIKEDYLENINHIHNRNLRNNTNFPIIRILNNTASKYSYKNTEVWNNLNPEIKRKNTLRLFTKCLKENLINEG